MRDFDNNNYWNTHNILSHNAMFNFIIGGRGTGKTYGSLKYCVRRFIKKRRMFIYLRRYDTELKKKDALLNDVGKEFPDHQFMIEGERILCRKNVKDAKYELMGYVMPLSTANNDKSIPFGDVDTIIFDEFIISKKKQCYMRGEVEMFLDFYNTVDRYNDRVRVFFLANSVSIVNPYFTYYKLTPRKRDVVKLYHDGYVAVQVLSSKNFKDAIDKTRFGKMIKNTAYYDYAVSNEFQDDNRNFIRKRPNTAVFYIAFRFDNEYMSIWLDLDEGAYFVDGKCPKNEQVYVLTKHDMQPNLIMIDRNTPILKGIVKMYQAGCVFFSNVNVRDMFYTMLDYLSLR